MENKKDLINYSGLLIGMYNEYLNNSESSGFNPNEIIKFLKVLGITDFKDFDKKFSEIAPQYTDLVSTSDKIEAIEDYKKIYERKIQFIDNLKEKTENTLNQDSNIIYNNSAKIVDYIELCQNNKTFKKHLPYYVDFLENHTSIKANTFKKLPEFGNIETTENLYNFIEFLAENEIKVSELVEMASNSYIDGISLFDILSNKKHMTRYISTLKDISIEDATKIYINFASEINALLSESKNSDKDSVFNTLSLKNNPIEILLNTIEKYNISPKNSIKENKNNTTFLSLYNDYFNKSEKKLSQSVLCELIGYLQLFNNKEEISAELKILKSKNKPDKRKSRGLQSKKNNSVFKIFDEEYKSFCKVKNEIISYLESDKSGFYAEKSPLDIYNEFKEELKCDGLDVYKILDSHKEGKSINTELYKQLSQYISETSELNNFIRNNKLNLENNTADNTYNNYCVEILKLLQDGDEKTENALSYLANSNFLQNSKNSLKDFFEKYDSDEQKKIMCAILHSKMASLDDFNYFIENYSNDKEEYNNLITALEKLPSNITFDEYLNNFIIPLQTRMNILSLPFKVNNDNILNIKPDEIVSINSLNNYEIIPYINKISNTTDGQNFILNIGLYMYYKSYASKANIVHELRQYNNTENDYSNIKRLLNIEDDMLEFEDGNTETEKFDKLIQIIPDDFVEFINGVCWYKDNFSGKIFNMSTHAKLRFLERYILPDINSTDELYHSKEMVEYEKDKIIENREKNKSNTK